MRLSPAGTPITYLLVPIIGDSRGLAKNSVVMFTTIVICFYTIALTSESTTPISPLKNGLLSYYKRASWMLSNFCARLASSGFFLSVLSHHQGHRVSSMPSHLHCLMDGRLHLYPLGRAQGLERSRNDFYPYSEFILAPTPQADLNVLPFETQVYLLCAFMFLLFFFYFIYFWLCWVFIAVWGLSLVAASGGAF